jgi:hypothetical protein
MKLNCQFEKHKVQKFIEEDINLDNILSSCVLATILTCKNNVSFLAEHGSCCCLYLNLNGFDVPRPDHDHRIMQDLSLLSVFLDKQFIM